MPRAVPPQIRVALLLILLGGILSYQFFLPRPSADLLPSWLAGVFYQSGTMDQIYPHDSAVFTMLPPPAWQPHMRAQGYDGPIFPFIYPPIWARLFGWLSQITDFARISSIASMLNPLLLGASALLAWRISGSRMPAARFVFVGMIVLFGTTPGMLALFQNQPQILVGFLILLAIERSRANAPLTAGAALALASAIKLYPAIFALLWLAAGHRRSFAAFLGFGATLAAFSIALTGWPLHQLFMHEVSVINQTVFVTGFTFSLDPMLGQLLFHHQIAFVPAPERTGGSQVFLGWQVMHKPMWWRLFSIAFMLAVISVLVALMRRRAPGNRALVWPLAISLIALASPLSWGYHYLPAIAFAPVLLDRFGTLRGGLVICLIFIPLSLPVMLSFKHLSVWLGTDIRLAQIAGTLLMIAYALAMARAGRPLAIPSDAPG